MIYALLKDHFDFFDGHTLFNTFEALMRWPQKFAVKEDREVLEKIYLLLIELSEQEEGLFSPEEEQILELYYISIYIQANLFTDDSFKVILILNTF